MKRLRAILCSTFAIAILGLFASHATVTHAAALSKTVSSYVTSYGYNDNDPPSADIAYPKSDGYATLHNKAYEGTGTYSDPVTFATDSSEIAIGTRIYIPYLEKYFIMEDDCAACDSDWSSSGSYHVDLWIGPESSSNTTKLDNCENYITRDSPSIIISPASTKTVDTTPLFKNNTCTAVIH